MVDIEQLANLYYVNMEAVPYELKKGGTIYIFPILTKEFLKYEWAKQSLLIDKNSTNDIQIIQMSYLEYLIALCNTNIDVEYQLRSLLLLCCKFPYIVLTQDKNRPCIAICNEERTVEKVISSKEFDDISKIILSQNDINYDDRYIDPDVKEMMSEYYKVKYKDICAPSFEKRKAFVSSKTGMSFKEINEIPFREFELIYEACKDSEIYIAQKIIQASEKYEVKGEIKHPLFEPKQDPYAELFVDTSVLSNKGISGAEQLNALNMQRQ